VARRYARERLFWKESAKQRKKALVPRIVRIIEADLMGRWTAESLGQRFGLRNNTVFRLLRESGTTATEIRTKARIRTARRILRRRKYPVRAVARRVGYRSRSYFSRLFAARVGLSPGAYRKKHRERAARRSSDLRKGPSTSTTDVSLWEHQANLTGDT
jgi:AraC-like DNA-binding protein